MSPDSTQVVCGLQKGGPLVVAQTVGIAKQAVVGPERAIDPVPRGLGGCPEDPLSTPSRRRASDLKLGSRLTLQHGKNVFHPSSLVLSAAVVADVELKAL